MALSLRMVSSLLLLVTVFTHCTDDESDVGSSGGAVGTGGSSNTGGRTSGGRADEGGSSGEAQGGAGNLPVGGAFAGAAGEGGISAGGNGNLGGAPPGGGSGGAGEELAPDCVPWGEGDGGGLGTTCCWECPPGEPCRHLECGNGVVDRGCLVPFECHQASLRTDIDGPYHYEDCDDGNQVDGDGCSSECTVEYSSTCGDGRIDALETCDDGNLIREDGCDEHCRARHGFHCDVPGEPCVPNVCGDGRGDESGCDDGNTNSGDGCSDLCDIELGWTCPLEGACEEAYCGNSSVDEYSNEDEDGFAGAWNVGGQLIRREDCDDGNQLSGDGCSAHCRLEEGWECPRLGSACHRPSCGDGYLHWSEDCDDGNNQPGDGCDEGCEIEAGWTCGRRPGGDGGGGGEGGDAGSAGGTTGAQRVNSEPPNVCARSACGDGVVYEDEDEECDDGNLRSGDGCSAECQVEGELCTGITEWQESSP
jgi:cysteine-rich repeat protein